MLSCKPQQDNYSYGRPAAVTTYDNKQYYQTSIAPAQRTPTENYYQTGESVYFYPHVASKLSIILRAERLFNIKEEPILDIKVCLQPLRNTAAYVKKVV